MVEKIIERVCQESEAFYLTKGKTYKTKGAQHGSRLIDVLDDSNKWHFWSTRRFISITKEEYEIY